MNYIKIISLMICLTALIMTGCAPQQKTQKKTVKTLTDCPSCLDFKNDKITANCILTIYNNNGGSFLTNQQHNFCLCNRNLIIKTIFNGREVVITAEKDGKFEIPKAADAVKNTPLQVFNGQICNLINQLVFANKSFVITSDKAQNIYGQWYKSAQKSGSNLKYYMNIDNNIVDLLISNNYIARGYDYIHSDIADRLLPSTVEISKIGSHGSPGDKIMKIEYKKFD